MSIDPVRCEKLYTPPPSESPVIVITGLLIGLIKVTCEGAEILSSFDLSQASVITSPSAGSFSSSMSVNHNWTW